MHKFWNWVKNEAGRILYLDGPIAQETWWGDEVTPALFKEELLVDTGPVTVWINSPGGDVFAAAQIYNMLMEYREVPNRRAEEISGRRGGLPSAQSARLDAPESGLFPRPRDDRGMTGGPVTVKIDGVAASAASVIAMAGGEVLMSPVSMMMCHNPATIAIGDGEEMLRAKALLDEVKESIINAYELKTGLPRAKLSEMMDAETWMNAHKAVELGFADAILFTGTEAHTQNSGEGLIFSRSAVTNSLLSKFPHKPTGTPIESLERRLNLLLH